MASIKAMDHLKQIYTLPFHNINNLFEIPVTPNDAFKLLPHLYIYRALRLITSTCVYIVPMDTQLGR